MIRNIWCLYHVIAYGSLKLHLINWSSYPSSSPGHTVRPIVCIQISLTRYWEYFVLSAFFPDYISSSSVQSHDPTHAWLFTVEIYITDNIRNIVPVGSYRKDLKFLHFHTIYDIYRHIISHICHWKIWHTNIFVVNMKSKTLENVIKCRIFFKILEFLLLHETLFNIQKLN